MKFGLIVSSALFIFSLALDHPAHAAAVLKQVSFSNGAQVDLLFDRKVSKNQVKTDFFNDIIQLSLSDTSVYPAKISTINSAALTKIFAYQYAPKLVRCRLSVKGNAETYKDKVQVSANGKMITIRLDKAEVDQLTLQSAQAVRQIKESPTATPDPEEKALMEKVLKSPEKVVPIATPEKPTKIAGGKPLVNPFRILMKLCAVIGLFILAAFALKKRNFGLNKAINRFAKGSFTKKKLIEVVSTHHLGPKKSIAVVKVGERVLVLGIANESINLITQLSGDGAMTDLGAELGGLSELTEELGIQKVVPAKAQRPLQGTGAVAAGPAMFADILSAEKTKPAPMESGKLSPSVRAKIRSKLEGLKPL